MLVILPGGSCDIVHIAGETLLTRGETFLGPGWGTLVSGVNGYTRNFQQP